MIVTENLGNQVRHYSDAGFYILQVETGKIYEDAVDVIPCKYTYTETDQKIEPDEEADAEDYQEALTELGVV